MNVRLKCDFNQCKRQKQTEKSDQWSATCKIKTLFKKSVHCIQKISNSIVISVVNLQLNPNFFIFFSLFGLEGWTDFLGKHYFGIGNES